ncbi:hypothetical protein NA56DRAFT_643708 [Hyaloscypha hepaticicola]|uniref:Uncharacterized protein n=1 Tax=Hyaloscypha hepaticicola TaxID=2082293 RepID=A0A2J6QBK1_9HELO|nr:hypothetical protein NA56DRAFT_643708 [Hyaloscypha hepaticicola]
MEVQHPSRLMPLLFPKLNLTSYQYATRSPERAASLATYLLISKAFIAPEVVFGVGEGVKIGVAVAVAVAALEEDFDVEAVVSLLEVLEAVTDVVIVRLEALIDDEEAATVLLLDGFELLLDGFGDVYGHDQHDLPRSKISFPAEAIRAGLGGSYGGTALCHGAGSNTDDEER